MALAFLKIFTVTIRPGIYFRESPRALLNRNVLAGALPWIVFGAFCVFLSAILNAEGIRAVQTEFLRRLDVDPKLIPQATGLPFVSLSFALYWLFLILLLGGLRLALVRIMGEAERSMLLSFLITLHSVLPMVLIGAAIAMFNNFFPPVIPENGAASGAALRLTLTALLSAAGFAWEGWIATVGFRQLYAQNTGRAVLTFLFPWSFVAAVILLLSR